LIGFVYNVSVAIPNSPSGRGSTHRNDGLEILVEIIGDLDPVVSVTAGISNNIFDLGVVQGNTDISFYS
jgi:hypothetical protein